MPEIPPIRMKLIAHKPLPPLSDFVEVVWLCESYDVPHQKERLLPDGSVELVINLAEDSIRVYDPHDPEKSYTIPGSVVSGPRSEFFVIDTAGEACTVGLHFKPGGAFPFFRVPVEEMTNESVALECLWGAAAVRLRERLLAASSSQAKLRVLECCLLEQLSKPLERHAAVAFAVNRLAAGASVSRVVEQTGFSQRRFIQLFSEEVGLTPKLFSRVSRFQKVIRTAHSVDEINWVQVALDCGYYDQPHFVHDFRSFAGITPSEYLLRKTPHVNHVPME
jgi:AraC-like DNA-binding protein